MCVLLLVMIGLTTAKSVKPSYYQTRGPKAPRVCDMAVSHDEKRYCATTYSGVIRPRDHLYRSRGTGLVDRVS